MNRFLAVAFVTTLCVFNSIFGQTLTINDGLSPTELGDLLIIEEDSSDPSFMPGNSDSAQISTGVAGNIGSFVSSGNSTFLLNNGVLISTNQAASAANTSIPPAGGGDSSFQFSFVALQENITIPFVFASEEYAGTQVCTSDEGVTFNINGPGVSNTTVLRVQDVREEQRMPDCPALRADEIAGGRGPGNPVPSFSRYTTTQNINLNTTIGETYTVDIQLNATDIAFDSAVFIGSFENVLNFDIPNDFSTCNTSETITGPTQFPVSSITWSGTGSFTQTGRDIEITSSGTYTLRVFVNGFVREKSVTVDFNGIMEGTPTTITNCAPSGSTSTTFMLGSGDFFLTRIDAEGGMNRISNPNSFIGTNGQTVFSRVVDGSGCATISEITLLIQNGIALSSSPRRFDFCDVELVAGGVLQNADGFEVVVLNDIATNFFPTTAGTFEFFDDNTLTTPARTSFNNTDNGTSNNEIFIRNISPEGCPSNAVPVTIFIQLPPLNIPNDGIEAGFGNFDDIIACDPDDPKDGFATFDLTEIITKINAGGATGITISIHPSIAEAESGSNAIPPTMIPNFVNTVINEQIIAARIVNTGEDCPVIRIVNLLARHLITESNIDPSTLEFTRMVCDNDADDSDPRDGFATFDLSTIKTDIAPAFNVEIFLDQASFDANTPLTDPELASFTNTTINEQQLIIGLSSTTPVCDDRATLRLEVAPEVIVNTPTTSVFERCDNTPDGVVNGFVDFFNINIRPEITPDTSLSFDIFTSLTDAENNTGAIDDTFTNTSSTSPITFWARAVSTSGCFDIVPFNIIVNPAPDASTPNTIFVCHMGTVPLQAVNVFQNQVIPPADQSLFNFDYYTLQSSANQIPQVANNLIPNAELSNFDITTIPAENPIVWVRVENRTTGCITVVPQQFIINTRPTIPTDIDFLLCIDPSAPLTADFDLGSRDPILLNGQPGKTVSYYETSLAASIGDQTAPEFIDKTVPFPSTIPEQNVFFRIENDDDPDCFNVGSFRLKIARNTPTLTTPGRIVCDDDNLDSDGNIDSSDIGRTVFDLQDIRNDITDSGRIGGLDINFFATEAEAGFSSDPTVETPEVPDLSRALPRFYKNEFPLSEEIIARITNSNNCTTFQSFFLTVLVNPVVDTIDEITFCDMGADNRENVDLTIVEADLDFGLNIRPPSLSDVTVLYFRSAQDRTDHDPGISPRNLSRALAQNFQVTAPNTDIFIRIVNNSTTCFFDAQFSVRLNPLPVITPNTVTQCENALDSNEFEITNLSDLNTTFNFIDPTDTSLSITYFNDRLGTSPISTPNFIKTNSINSIFASVTNSDTRCSSEIIEIPLIARRLPELSIPTPDQARDCDDDGITPGSKIIDFNTKFDAIILQTEIARGRTTSEFTVRYFDSSNTELTPTSNISTGMYRAVVEEIITDPTIPSCTNEVSFSFTLNTPPIATAPEAGNVVRCDTDLDGNISLNLNDFDSTVRGSQTGPEFVVTYHSSESDAISGIEIPEDSVGESIVSSGSFVTKITNTNTECFDTVSFNIDIILPPDFNVPTTLLLCENAFGSNLIDFDLNDVTEFQNPGADNQFSFFRKIGSETAPIATNEIINGVLINENAASIPTIFVVLTNTITNCFLVKETQIAPKRIPSIEVPPVSLTTICDQLDDSGTPGSDRDNLTVFDSEFKNNLDIAILNGRSELDFEVNYFNAADVPVNLDDVIVSGDYYATISQRVPPLTPPSCGNTSALFPININPIPTATIPANTILCDTDSSQNGVISFDFEASFNSIILGSQSPTDFEVTYHDSEEDAERGIISPDFTSGSASTGIYVAKVTDLATLCATTISLDIIVNLLPIINQLPGNPEYCNGEFFADRRATLIRALSPTSEIVTFHTAASANSSNEITDNIPTPPSLFIRAVNTFTLSDGSITECENIQQIFLDEVNSPILNITSITNAAKATCDNLDGLNDGQAIFDFSFIRNEIRDMQADPSRELAVSFHLTEDDANDDVIISDNQPLTSGVYFVKAIDVNAGCRNMDAISLTIESPPINILGDVITFCSNDPSREISAETTENEGITVSYLWEFFDEQGNTTRTAETSSSITLTPADIGNNARLTVIDNDSSTNCGSVQVAEIREATSPVVNPIAIKDFISEEIEIEVPEPGEYLYSLVEFGAEPDITVAQESNIFQDLLPGIFTVYVFNVEGCDPTRIDVPFINYLPAFTPNGSGPALSERWHIIGVEQIPETLVYIFNRFGKLLVTLTSNSEGWDGTYNGAQLPSDDYWVLIRLADGQEIKDHITLKR